ncbi:MAG: UDP-N-acetylmuramoyl-tripeptide--D-alanyl-D-alanine ligase [Oscillospiraceae bacterium]|nr:UDP-N-acetylmuramoyl-tripeptide--D-alanyl-D-alanine ligase [Oscillospiraceae bacterium]
MRDMTLENIAGACGGKLYANLEICRREISFITTDSRKSAAGCLFAAIKGERSDGHDFTDAAAAGGALCCLCKREPDNAALPYIKVDSTLSALSDIAAFYRSLFDIPVLGITGSVGKTSTKDMTASILSQKYNTLKTRGNFNNELGVPLTVFELNEKHEAAVIEMGISDFYEMDRLARIVKPDMALYTVIGHSHLEFLKSREGVFRAKAEMLRHVPDKGTVFINGDDDLLRKAEYRQKTVTFGFGKNCDVRAENPSSAGVAVTKCDIISGDRRISALIRAHGEHMIYAALGGAAVGMHLGLSNAEIQKGVSEYEPASRRSVLKETAFCTVIDDCYNANPNSVEAALGSMRSFKGRKVCILGDMRELGPASEELHRRVGQVAALSGTDLLICCGAEAEYIYHGAFESEMKPKLKYFASKKELTGALSDLIERGDTVLVKASRGAGFEEIVTALENMN